MNRNYANNGQQPPPLPSRNGRTNMKCLPLDSGTNDMNKLGSHAEAAPSPPSLVSISKRNLTASQSLRRHEPPSPPSRDHNRLSPIMQHSTLRTTQKSRSFVNKSTRAFSDDSLASSGTFPGRHRQLPPVPATSQSQLVAVPSSVLRISEVPPPLPERPHKMTDLVHDQTHASTKPAAANGERNFEDRFVFHNIKAFPVPEPIEFQKEEKEIKTAKSMRGKSHHGHRTCSNLGSL